jgi:hypothetical protein
VFAWHVTRVCDSSHYLLLRRGDSATRDVRRRLRRSLRLRFAPPSAVWSVLAFTAVAAHLTFTFAAAAAHFGVMHARASKLRSRLRALEHDSSQPAAIHSPRGWPERGRGKCRARALKHDSISAPEDSLRGEPARASESEASRERSSMIHLNPRRFTRREVGQSEGAASAALERSNHVSPT